MFENINVYKCVCMALCIHLSKFLGQAYYYLLLQQPTHTSLVGEIVKKLQLKISLNFTYYIFMLYFLILKLH